MAKQFNHGYALLIAVNESEAEGAALPDVIKDATALRDVLVHPGRCAYPAKNVKLLAGAESTRDGITGGLDWLRENLEADKSGEATAIIYFTGHGHTEGGNYYLIPYDVSLKRIKTSALRAEDFAEEVAALQPRRLLVLFDCCHAAGMQVKDLQQGSPFHAAGVAPALFMGGQKAITPASGGKGLEALTHGAGRAVLNSCEAKQQSWIRKDGKMSIFTYHLIEALTGRAQPQAGAKDVLVSDIISHVCRRVPESADCEWGAVQYPWCEVSGSFPVALLLGGKGLGAGETAPEPLDLPDAATPRSANYSGSASNGSAIAQGENAQAATNRGVVIGGNNSGNINTGTRTTIIRHRRDRD